jgi:hypothetical protein
MPVFEYTLKAASLKDPAPTLPLYAKVAQSREETTRTWMCSRELSTLKSSSPRRTPHDCLHDMSHIGIIMRVVCCSA